METFQGLVNGYLHHLEAQPSWRNYRNLCDQYFANWLEHPSFLHIHTWHRTHQATPHQANKALSFLKAMYAWGLRFGRYTGSNPATGIKAHRTYSRERVMNTQEIAVLLACLDMVPQKIGTLLLVLLTTGARLNEALAMKEEHVNVHTGDWMQPHTKNKKIHLTYLPTQARAALALLIKHEGYFFAGGVDGHWSDTSAEKSWGKVRGSLGLQDVRLHDFRRTLATHLYRATKDEYLVKRCINHVNRNITAIYVRISPEEVAKALQAQADRFCTIAEPPQIMSLPPIERTTEVQL